MKLAVFAYDFPHKKTQDFLFRLLLENYTPTLVIGAPWVKLNIRQPALRAGLKHIDVVETAKVCERFSIPYIVKPHNDPAVQEILKKENIDIGIIAGARILQAPIINAVTTGIINFHPGLIPEVRGLDTLHWAVYDDKPLGVTAHFIETEIDAGRIIQKQHVPIFSDDTVRDIWTRMEQTQTNMLPEVLEMVEGKKLEDFGKVDILKGKYYKSFDPDKEPLLEAKFEVYLKKYATDKNSV